MAPRDERSFDFDLSGSNGLITIKGADGQPIQVPQAVVQNSLLSAQVAGNTGIKSNRFQTIVVALNQKLPILLDIY